MVKQVTKKTVTETVDDNGNKKTVVTEHAPKVSGEKKSVSKKTSTAPKEKKMTAKEREELLIENFVGLQHAMTNMSIKFSALSDNMSKLLSVFEEAAKGFVVGDKTDDKDMLNKIDSLLDQNKTIAKGLVMMEERVRTRVDNAGEAKKIADASQNGMHRVNESSPQNPPSPQPKTPQNGQLNSSHQGALRPKPLPRI